MKRCSVDGAMPSTCRTASPVHPRGALIEESQSFGYLEIAVHWLVTRSGLDKMLWIYDDDCRESYVDFKTHDVPNHMKSTLFWSWLLFVIYLFLLPIWSILFNDILNFHQYCDTPAERMHCSGGLPMSDELSFAEIAQGWHRFSLWFSRWRDDLEPPGYYGCRSGQGIVPEWMCAPMTPSMSVLLFEDFGLDLPTRIFANEFGFTLSHFIGSAPCTGAMACVSVFPILGMWWYGGGHELYINNLKRSEVSKLYLFTLNTLLVFNLTFFIFLVASGWCMGWLHLLITFAFISSAFCHFCGVAAISMRQQRKPVTRHVVIVVALTSLSSTFFSLGVMSTAWHKLMGYGFFLAECFGLSMIFAVVPCFVFFAQDDRTVFDGTNLIQMPAVAVRAESAKVSVPAAAGVALDESPSKKPKVA